ncbi:MAG TPA: HAD-IIIC family phosphatase [Fimbriimonadaceae bacterium]|nr:HAD-IIIC family phosphatase [Fimbriimonadaceae bacterium]
MSSTTPVSVNDVKAAYAAGDPCLAGLLGDATRAVEHFEEALQLHNVRRRAVKDGKIEYGGPGVRIAFIGGYTLSPLSDLAGHCATVFADRTAEVWTGDYDNYVAEIMDPQSGLYGFEPDVVVLLPNRARCRYAGPLGAPPSDIESAAGGVAGEVLQLCAAIHERTSAQVILVNLPLPGGFDPGPFRTTSLGSDYAFSKRVNTLLGLGAPPFVHVCDAEFLANRIGTIAAADIRTWFESKQPFSAAMEVQVAKEIGHIVSSLTKPPKKVIVLDLDNTLWGGVIGDDGLDGIEIGTTSPRGEAFRYFQEYLLELRGRGILLAVCSKNDQANAVLPFTDHPEMVLKLGDVVNFKANWETKAENIRLMATELGLGLDSFVLLDDNPAEIEIVRQFVPEVTGICLGEDPSLFVPMVADSRLFELRTVTSEDLERSKLYAIEAKRQELKSTTLDLPAYWGSLEMVAEVANFNSTDRPRITQLVNKSNQFNLTTRRRTESEIADVESDPATDAFAVRLRDRFGDHGLIAVVIGQIEGSDYVIDTWLMSCRVLSRQVEEATLNEMAGAALVAGCTRIVGVYRPTAKNGLVAGLFPRLGFGTLQAGEAESTYELDLGGFEPRETKILVKGRVYG